MKNKNDLVHILKKNAVLSSKLDFVLKENDSLKNKIVLNFKELEYASKERNFVLQEKNSLKTQFEIVLEENEKLYSSLNKFKNDFVFHVCHDSIASSSCVKNVVSHACSTSSSNIDNDIHILKKSVDCLDSTLSQCATNHKRLKYMFRKKHAPHMHAHH